MASASLVHAAGFALSAQDAFGAGTAGAFAATSAGYANPASVVSGWTVGGALVTSRATSRFAGSEAGFAVQGRPYADPGRSAGIPYVNYSRDLTPQLAISVGVDAPFGLATRYPSNWVGRYVATESSVEAGQIKLGARYRASEKLSLGANVAVQHAKMQVGQSVDYGAACLMMAAVLPSMLSDCAAAGLVTVGDARADGRAKVKLASTAVGGQFGALWKPSSGLAVGMAYTLPMKHRFAGKVKHDAPLAAPALVKSLPALQSGRVHAAATFPGSVVLGAQLESASGHRFAATLQRTYWSSVDDLILRMPQAQQNRIRFGLKDSNRLAVGADVRIGRGWRGLVGAAYDRSPVRQSVRMPILPDGDRRVLSVGLRSPRMAGGYLTVGWMREFLDNARVNQTTSIAHIHGAYRRIQVDTVGVSFTVGLDS